MMPIRDFLAEEDNDARRAAAAAAQGRSMTGLSGRQTEIEDRFASGNKVFGGTADRSQSPEPIAGERVQRREVGRELPEGVAALAAHDPLFRERRFEAQERQPFGDQEQTLSYPKRPGYRAYWFNDRAGRITRAKKAGYAHVLNENGEPVCRVTDVIDGRGRSSYLMEIPIEWYQQDMAKNAMILEGRLDDIRKGRAGPGADENRYVPQQGIRIERR